MVGALSGLSLVAAIAVSGVVQAPDGRAVAGALVVVQQGGREIIAVTNERGEFDLSVALPVTIDVRADGFTSVRQTVTAWPVTVTLWPAHVRESVIVSAAAPQDAWRRPATGTTVLPSTTLERTPAVTLDESLRVLSGLTLFRRSSSRASNPTTHGVTMRGLSASGASRGLVLFDGVPLNEGFGGWVTWTRVPPGAIEAVSVDRGAQGAVFGSDALGGVIAIQSRAAKPQIEVGATGGGPDLWSMDAAAGLRRGPWSGFAAASALKTGGIIPVAPESRGVVDVKAGAEWVSGFGRVAHEARGRRVAVSLLSGSDDRGNGTPLQNNSMRGRTITITAEGLFRGTRLAAQTAYASNDFDQTFSQIGASRATETLTASQDIRTMASRTVLEAGRGLARTYLTGRLTVARADARFSEFRASTGVTTTAELQDDSTAFAAHAGWMPAARLSVGAGARHETRRAPRQDASSDAATVAQISASWVASSTVTIRGSAATSHRWPTLNELVRGFQVGAVLTQANPDLAPERARSGDIALSLRRWGWQVTATGFRNVVHDAIANVTIRTSPSIIRQRQNAGEARARGLELDVDGRPIARARVRLSALVVDARFGDSREPALEGNWLPQVPRVSLSLSGDIDLGHNTVVGLVFRTIGSQFDDDRNMFRLARAAQLDARLAGRAGPFTWHVTFDNALDQRIEVGRTPLVTLAPDRAIRVGATWRR